MGDVILAHLLGKYQFGYWFKGFVYRQSGASSTPNRVGIACHVPLRVLTNLQAIVYHAHETLLLNIFSTYQLFQTAKTAKNKINTQTKVLCSFTFALPAIVSLHGNRIPRKKEKLKRCGLAQSLELRFISHRAESLSDNFIKRKVGKVIALVILAF